MSIFFSQACHWVVKCITCMFRSLDLAPKHAFMPFIKFSFFIVALRSIQEVFFYFPNSCNIRSSTDISTCSCEEHNYTGPAWNPADYCRKCMSSFWLKWQVIIHHESELDPLQLLSVHLKNFWRRGQYLHMLINKVSVVFRLIYNSHFNFRIFSIELWHYDI